MPRSDATSFRLCPHPLPQSKSQKGVLIETASTSTPCSRIILTAKLLSRPPDKSATAFFFCVLVSGVGIGFFYNCFRRRKTYNHIVQQKACRRDKRFINCS